MFLFGGDNIEFGPILFQQIAFIAWSLFCAISATCISILSLRQNGLHTFYLQLQYLTDCFASAECGQYARQKTTMYTVVGWLVLLVNMVYGGYGLYGTPAWESILYPITLSSPYYYVAAGVYLIVHLYLSAAWTLGAVFTFLVCKIIYHEFVTFNKALKQVTSGRKDVKDNIQRLRSWHQHLCHLVETADDMLTVEIGAGFVLYIVIECVVIYNLIWDQNVSSDILSLVTVISWVLLSMFHMALLSVAGGIVNEVVSTIIIILLLHEIPITV
jgi:hypothetical protein